METQFGGPGEVSVGESHQSTNRELWKRVPAKGGSKDRALAVGIAAVALLLAPLVLEREFLSSPQGETVVTISGVQDERPQGTRTPASFRYRVSLKDGSQALFISDRIQPEGTDLIVTVLRGRLTGRLWLTGPYRPARALSTFRSAP